MTVSFSLKILQKFWGLNENYTGIFSRTLKIQKIAFYIFSVTSLQMQKNQQVQQKSQQIMAADIAQKQQQQTCEICDTQVADKDQYLIHLQKAHEQLLGKTASDMVQGAPYECGHCQGPFWTYEGEGNFDSRFYAFSNKFMFSHSQVWIDTRSCPMVW
jgi:hypothetical protein